jgi:hypothetical protein
MTLMFPTESNGTWFRSFGSDHMVYISEKYPKENERSEPLQNKKLNFLYFIINKIHNFYHKHSLLVDNFEE